jgi:hypothetical protein
MLKVYGFDHRHVAGWIVGQLISWANGAGDKAAAAIRANIVQYAFNAVAAKGALKAADSSFCRIRHQGFGAMLAARSKLQHALSALAAEFAD